MMSLEEKTMTKKKDNKKQKTNKSVGDWLELPGLLKEITYYFCYFKFVFLPIK